MTSVTDKHLGITILNLSTLPCRSNFLDAMPILISVHAMDALFAESTTYFYHQSCNKKIHGVHHDPNLPGQLKGWS